jgi:hypothetical protein
MDDDEREIIDTIGDYEWEKIRVATAENVSPEVVLNWNKAWKRGVLN